MPVYTDEEARKMSYFELSIVTGRDVYPSPITDWFMGGLNYQIEHHLFPSMPRHNLKRVAPLIKTLCKKHSIPYHTTSFTSGLLEVVGQLNNISQIHRKKSQ
jgi:fatty acid desaturase